MRLIPRLGLRTTPSPKRRRPATTHLRVSHLEHRSLPSFGFGSAFRLGGDNGDDRAYAIATDTAGSTYVAGYFASTVDFDPSDVNDTNSAAILTAASTHPLYDSFVAKYSADGAFQWVTDLGTNLATEVAVQNSSVYVSHRSNNPSLPGEYVSRLDSNTGVTAWTTTITAAGFGVGVAVSPTGILYGSGATGNSGSPSSQTMVDRLDPGTGNILWTQTSTGGSATAGSLAADGAGNVYVSGGIKGTTTFGSTSLTSYSGVNEEYIWKLNPSGASVWAGAMGGSGGTSPGSITADASGNVYATGSWSGGTNNWTPGSGKAVSLRRKRRVHRQTDPWQERGHATGLGEGHWRVRR
jgi:hypothetical protein